MAFACCIADWLSEVDNIALSSTIAEPVTQGGYLRAMGFLISSQPPELGGVGMTPAGQSDIMQNVMMGAYETAAMRLLPSDAQVMTSSPGEGRYLATVRLHGQQCESTSSGNTFALALVSALALSIVDRYHETAGSPPR